MNTKAHAERFDPLTKRIESLPEAARFAVAVAVTQRLVDHYYRQPEDERSEFVAPWAEMTPLLWSLVLSVSSADLKRILEMRMKEYLEEVSIHCTPEHGQPQFAQDAAYACINAIEAYCTGSSKAAAGVASFLLDHAQSRAREMSRKLGEDLMSASAQARVLRFRLIELDRLERAVGLLEHGELSAEMVARLRDLLTSEDTLDHCPDSV